MRTYRKIVVSGDILEVYEYEKPCFYNFKSKGGRRKSCDDDSDRATENRRTATKRARDAVRRMALANFTGGDKFVTLTFAENLTDIDRANRAFKQFIQRLRRRYKFKYIAVIEFQERGAIHFHMLCDLPFIKKAEFAELWGNGFIKVNKIDHVDNVGAYMVKYMLKDIDDSRLRGRKAYLTSKGLKQSDVVRGDTADAIYDGLGLGQIEKVFYSSYESEHHGTITYNEYNLKRVKKDQGGN